MYLCSHTVDIAHRRKECRRDHGVLCVSVPEREQGFVDGLRTAGGFPPEIAPLYEHLDDLRLSSEFRDAAEEAEVTSDAVQTVVVAWK